MSGTHPYGLTLRFLSPPCHRHQVRCDTMQWSQQSRVEDCRTTVEMNPPQLNDLMIVLGREQSAEPLTWLMRKQLAKKPTLRIVTGWFCAYWVWHLIVPSSWLGKTSKKTWVLVCRHWWKCDCICIHGLLKLRISGIIYSVLILKCYDYAVFNSIHTWWDKKLLSTNLQVNHRIFSPGRNFRNHLF